MRTSNCDSIESHHTGGCVISTDNRWFEEFEDRRREYFSSDWPVNLRRLNTKYGLDAVPGQTLMNGAPGLPPAWFVGGKLTKISIM